MMRVVLATTALLLAGHNQQKKTASGITFCEPKYLYEEWHFCFFGSRTYTCNGKRTAIVLDGYTYKFLFEMPTRIADNPVTETGATWVSKRLYHTTVTDLQCRMMQPKSLH